jgi:hypothetical protein
VIEHKLAQDIVFTKPWSELFMNPLRGRQIGFRGTFAQVINSIFRKKICPIVGFRLFFNH